MKKLLILIILYSCLYYLSCGEQQEADKQVFSLNQSLGIETLEPVMSNSAQTIWGLTLCMEGLAEFNKENKIEPLLAREWNISSDGLAYTFKLRDNVFFHDDVCFPGGKGRKVKASDFKYVLERVNDPSTKTRGLWVFRDRIKGAKEYYESRTGKGNPVQEITGLKALDDSTLIIELTEPFAPFLSLLTMSYGYVYPKEAVDHYKEGFGQHPVGTGPFKFDRWVIDQELVFTKNPNYWQTDESGTKLPYLDEIKFSFTQSSETEFLDFENGKYDMHIPSSETYDLLVDESGNLRDAASRNYSLVRQPWLNTVYIIMIQNPSIKSAGGSPFVNNLKLRQALNYAVDRDKIVRYVLKNRGFSAINGPLPKGMPGYDENIKGYTYDKEKAKQLLTEAGYPNGLELTLALANDEIQKSIAIALQEQLREVGINVKLEQMLQATLLSKQQDGEFAFTRGSWGADYFDPENFMALFYSKNIIPHGPNKTGYNNPRFDALYEQANKLTDFNERKKLYDEMQKIVIEDAAWLYLYYNQQAYLVQKNVEGFNIDGLNIINLKHTKKK